MRRLAPLIVLSAMARRLALPSHLKDLANLVRAGMLYDLEAWLAAGKPVRTAEIPLYHFNILSIAVDTGFHTLVQSMLKHGQWLPDELADALDAALAHRRIDLADLLIGAGAPLADVDFCEVCRTMDVNLMERFLRLGISPDHGNAFARALTEFKARPLLRFYKQFRTEFPTLDDQAALALAEAVRGKQLRWTALLRWAGANPLKKVPTNLDEDLSSDPEGFRSAADEAHWSDNVEEFFKVLKITPSPAEACELLEHLTFRPSIELVKQLLSAIPRDQINGPDGRSCKALEELVDAHNYSSWFGGDRYRDQPEQTLKAIQLLLDHGAKWNPPLDQLRYVRRGLSSHDAKHIVKVLRLLIYTPNTAPIDTVYELCRSAKMRSLITAADPPLWAEIVQLRRAQR